MPGGEFDWGSRLRKGIGGAQRFPQNGWKPFEECKGRRELDCDTGSRGVIYGEMSEIGRASCRERV